MARKHGMGLYGLWAGTLGGAGLMYLLDPALGRRRRARVEEKAQRAAHKAERAAYVAVEDLGNRSRGLLAELASTWKAETVSDQVLLERVRAQLGRLCTHPHSVEVAVHDGQVELSGPILASEAPKLLRGLQRIQGVRGLDDRLELHPTHDIPALQGSGRPSRPLGWTPAVRLVATGAGLGLLGAGLGSRGRGRLGLAGLGGLLAFRGLTDLSLGRLLGFGAHARAVELTKTSNINAPLDEVFSYLRNLENFPRFLSHVKRVERVGDNCWRWTLEGTAGVPYTFDAEVTRFVPNRLLAWRSLGNAAIKSAGLIHFDPTRRGTRLQIELKYSPPAGEMGHAFMKIFGADPRRMLDDDLLRFKSLLEHGKATGHETVTREQLQQPSAHPS